MSRPRGAVAEEAEEGRVRDARRAGLGRGRSAPRPATLTFMVGGDDGGLRARPADPRRRWAGRSSMPAPPGSGQTAKICNNMMLAVLDDRGVRGLSRSPRSSGLPAQTLFDICSTSTSQCWAMTNYCPVPGPVPAAPSNRGYAAGFTAANMLKDLRLAQQAAGAAGGGDPLGGGGRQSLPALCRRRGGRARLLGHHADSSRRRGNSAMTTKN